MSWIYVETVFEDCKKEKINAIIDSITMIKGVSKVYASIPNEIEDQIKNKKDELIFSGENSKDMWNSINDENYKEAIYILGCKLQELEHFVRKNINLTDKTQPTKPSYDGQSRY